MIRKEHLHPNRSWWFHETTIQSYPIHWHTYYEAELITAGTGLQIINGCEESICRGTLTLLSPQDFHRLEASPNSTLTIRKIGILPDFLSPDIQAQITAHHPPFLLQLDEDGINRFDNLFSAISSLEAESEPYRNLLAERILELLLIRIMQSVGSGQEIVTLARPAHPDEKNFRILQPVLSYIDTHFAEPLNRTALAELIPVSPCYLSIRFRAVLGISLSDYITDCRMKCAKSLLRSTDLTISAVMEQSGFESTSLFYRKFSQYFGQSPGTYRKKRSGTVNAKTIVEKAETIGN